MPHPLFDSDWYLRQNRDVAEAGVNPLQHFMTQGWHEGRDPHPLFDTSFYLDQNPDVAAAEMNPLVHYSVQGWTEGRDPHPLFDTSFYLEQNPDVAAAAMNPLVHYSAQGWIEGRDPHPFFNTSWYLQQNKDVAASGQNPLHHYCELGWREGRNPHSNFDLSQYLRYYEDVASHDINPLVHYVCDGQREGRKTFPVVASIAASPSDYAAHSVFVPRSAAAPLDNRSARLIAFYLPQFHPIPENDLWWGEGFTEWSNVKPAQPQFKGHYQPHTPIDLGYYDLRDPTIQKKQIEIAQLYGIGGFCFYFYWFGGKRLLETPVENWLNDKSLDFPFCLCWANENWSRRWDGLNSEVLIAQDHSPEDDIAFLREVARYMRDPRHIRIDGKPLLVVYRPNLLPSAKETAARWRQWCRENGIGDIYLAYTQSFEKVDPAIYGFDAAIEFPPNNSSPTDITSNVIPLREDFGSTVYDWRIFSQYSESYPPRSYTIFRSVCPGWDNTARRKNGGTVWINNTPALYQHWLENAIKETIANAPTPDQRLIFVNAWNEWAEGAHLEPDQQTGYAYLQATRDALVACGASDSSRITIVSHDAHPHGAQLLALNLARTFCDDFKFQVDFVSLGGGPLLDQFGAAGTLHSIEFNNRETALAQLADLRRKGSQIAIVNTAASGEIVPLMKQAGFVVISLIHELPGLLKSYSLEKAAAAITEHADKIVFASDIVRNGFETFTGKELKNAHIRPQGLYLRSPYKTDAARQIVRAEVRQELALPAEARIVISVGYADHRKGVDLFVESLLDLMAQDPSVYAIWVGHHEQQIMDQQRARMAAARLEHRFRFTGLVREPQRYYSAADVFALTSREDPFPSVVMEAFDAGLPVVAFHGAGGSEDLLKRGCGILSPAFDTRQFGRALAKLLHDGPVARQLAEQGRRIVDRELSFRHYVFDLLDFAGQPLPRISVIVPNYNYARYLRQRLETIAAQTVPIFELIVLDDASTDNSLEIAEDFLTTCSIPHALVRNGSNSGSAFRQWLRGVEMARGDLVWIAEADDLADPEFLENVVPAFSNPGTVLSYSQSRQMDENGTILAGDYLNYVSDIDPEKWRRPYLVDGRKEIETALFVKNTIPNVSAVVFRRDTLLAALADNRDQILSYRNAGDWVTYLRILEQGSIAFCPRALNSHRRHAGSVTVGNFNLRHLQEIVRVQQDTAKRFGLSANAQARAGAYAQRLYEQFGLAESSHPLFEMHPQLAIHFHEDRDMCS